MASRSSSVHSTSFAYTEWVQHFTEETFLAVHEVKKPFKCDICDYSCSRKNHSNKHFATVHEGKEPIKCDICEYSCFQNSDMKRHAANVHEGKKPFIFTKFLRSFMVCQTIINNPSKRISSHCALPI